MITSINYKTDYSIINKENNPSRSGSEPKDELIIHREIIPEFHSLQDMKLYNPSFSKEVKESNILKRTDGYITDKTGSVLKSLYSTIGGVTGYIAGGVMAHVIKPTVFNIASKKKGLKNKIESCKGSMLHKKDELFHKKLPPLTTRHLKAANITGNMVRSYDGYDSSRDIFALYSNEGKTDENYTFQLEVANLRDGAEYGHLDTYFLLNWGDKKGNEKLPFQLTAEKSSEPWKCAVKIDRNKSGEIIDSKGKSGEIFENICHSTEYSNIEFQLDKKLLREMGWKDGETLHIQAFTARDGETKVSDSITASTDVKGSREILDNIFRWDGKVIYYAVTDRFYDGDKTNNEGIDLKDKERFHGGDWQGIIEKLDYLKDLGIDCVWISCPYLNDRGFFGKDGFHGYWPQDFYKPEPQFGDMDKLRELCNRAHEKGIKIMLDVVVNHTGYNHPFVKDPAYSDWYHARGDIKGYSEYHMVNGALAGLPDLAQEKPEVKRFLIDAHKWWIEQADIDGFRVDAARHVPEEFLQEFNETLHDKKENFYTVGEAFWRDPNFIAGLQNRGLDAMFDFPMTFAIRNVFASKKDDSFWNRLKFAMEHFREHPGDAIEKLLRKSNPGMKLLSEAMENDRYYDNPKKLGTMIDNHDMSRFMAECGGDLNMLDIALSFLMSARGVPCIYYGTEAGLDGTSDDNRKDMPWGQNPSLTEKVRKMTEARNSSPALQYGTQIELKAAQNVYAHVRMRPEEEVICIFNNGETPEEIEIPLEKNSQIMKGNILEDLISGNKITAGEKTVTVTLPSRGYAYYQWKKDQD
jgi:alpha-amylase